MDFDAIWLELTQFFAIDVWLKAINILVIIVGALVIRWVLRFVIDRVVQQIVTGVKKNQNVEDTQALSVSPLAAVRVVQRTRTLGSVLSNILNVTLLIVSILLIVNEIDPAILGSFALLTAALGAGLGFGAQNIVKDILNGLFMVVEDQIGVGDIVDVGFASGVVETVGIRVTQVRDIDGTLWFVRNGEILRVGNMSQGWARVIIDLAIPYSSDVEAVQNELLRVAKALTSSRKWRSMILEKPEIWGLESISAEALVVRLVVKTRVAAKWDFARDLRLHLKRALDGLGIGLTPLNSVVMAGTDGAITAASDPASGSGSGSGSGSEERPDAAAQAAAAMPDLTTGPFTGPIPVRKGKAPRTPRRPKNAGVALPSTVAATPTVADRDKVAPKAPTPPTEAPTHTAPDPEINHDE